MKIQQVPHPPAVSRRSAAAAAASLVLAGWHLNGRAAEPSISNQSGAGSDLRVRTYEAYLAAWVANPDDERARLLREALSDRIVFTNPTQTRLGLADVGVHLREFQQRNPGASFRMIEMLGWNSHGMATWQLIDAAGRSGFSGYDVLAFDAQGRIESILMFTRVEKQIVK
jgi:hypothetical protein